MVLLAKDKLNTIEVLISKNLIDKYIGHDEFVSVNNGLKEYDDIKKAIKNQTFFHSDNKYGWYNKKY